MTLIIECLGWLINKCDLHSITMMHGGNLKLSEELIYTAEYLTL